MNRQEVFTKVATHLLNQMEVSESHPGACAYRGENGTMCAVGCLIKDEFMKSEFNGSGVTDSRVLNALNLSGIKLEYTPGECGGDGDIHFLIKLQDIHDLHDPNVWNKQLENFALVRGLEMPKVSS